MRHPAVLHYPDCASPAKLFRVVRNEIKVDAVTTLVGATVTLSFSAANRDPPDAVNQEKELRTSVKCRPECPFLCKRPTGPGGIAIVLPREDAVAYRPHFFAYGPSHCALNWPLDDKTQVMLRPAAFALTRPTFNLLRVNQSRLVVLSRRYPKNPTELPLDQGPILVTSTSPINDDRIIVLLYIAHRQSERPSQNCKQSSRGGLQATLQALQNLFPLVSLHRVFKHRTFCTEFYVICRTAGSRRHG